MHERLSRMESSTCPQILLYTQAARTGYFSHILSYTRHLQRTFLNITNTTHATKLTRHIFLPISILGVLELENQEVSQNSPLLSKKQLDSTLNTPSTTSLPRD